MAAPPGIDWRGYVAAITTWKWSGKATTGIAGRAVGGGTSDRVLLEIDSSASAIDELA